MGTKIEWGVQLVNAAQVRSGLTVEAKKLYFNKVSERPASNDDEFLLGLVQRSYGFVKPVRWDKGSPEATRFWL